MKFRLAISLLWVLCATGNDLKADNANCCIAFEVQIELESGVVHQGKLVYEYPDALGDVQLTKFLNLNHLDSLIHTRFMYGDSIELFPMWFERPLITTDGSVETRGYFVPHETIVRIAKNEIKSTKVLTSKCLCCPKSHKGDSWCACIPTCQVIRELSLQTIRMIRKEAAVSQMAQSYDLHGAIMAFSFNPDFQGESLRTLLDTELNLNKFESTEQSNSWYLKQQIKYLKMRVVFFRLAVQI